ncbi:hypothetical protein GIB67_036552 [Kingdonia uniflora]|uniref:Uncharacterized protein n=1 Tax=Kingdonia uniflora TaxID=39325 RepID=A0A7J7P043_9MAGN|nr:hypothetical protein GIB67_036552 [Kingdonia uniflora]
MGVTLDLTDKGRGEVPFGGYNTENHSIKVCSQSKKILYSSSRGFAKAREEDESSCLTGNPIDDCWRCDFNGQSNWKSLADYGIGFGHDSFGGKGGHYYEVTDSSDSDENNLKPGTLRYGVIQIEPLWITFASNIQIMLKEKLIIKSFQTIDERGANVEIIGKGCLTVEFISNIVIHNAKIENQEKKTRATAMEMATTAAKYVAATIAKYASDLALRHIGATTMGGATLMKEFANPTVLYINYHVVKVQGKVMDLDHQATTINSSFEGWCYACHHLGKELEKKLDELLAQGRIFSSVSNPAPVLSSVGEHFDVFASREATKKKIIQALMDDQTKLVGVYGMGGVGKNTSKVLITSGRLDVCTSMETTKNIEVKVLSKNDSLELFRQEVCDVDFDARRKCSKKIVDKCDGLPLVIVALG